LAPLNVCLQVNVDGEAGKSGIDPAVLPELALAVQELPQLRLRGLMSLPEIRTNFDEQRKPFRKLRELGEFLSANNVEFDTLSMGMSDDFEAAIAEGSTIVRIGTAVFGPRA
jgi:pyridoxal phosphate enzyme (YggS family)